MLHLPDVTIVHILAALPHTDILTRAVRVCRNWHALRFTEHFRAARAAVDERGLVVAGGFDGDRWNQHCRVLVGGRWFERASLPHEQIANRSVLFRDELVILGNSSRSLVFNLEANAWDTLEWGDDGYVWAVCVTDAMVVVFSSEGLGVPSRLRSLRIGDAEGWGSIPDPPEDVLSHRFPSLCCVENTLYVFGGVNASGDSSDACQAFDFSSRAWTTLAPLPEPRSTSLCVQLAGCICVVSGESVEVDEFVAGVCSYDPQTNKWKSESPLPIGNYGAASISSGLRAVAHEGRLVVLGICDLAPPLALVDDVWTELPPLPQDPAYPGTTWSFGQMASLRL